MEPVESAKPLRDKVREKLCDSIVFGDLDPSQRLGLTSLARSLGVSETPVREALTQLENQGFLRLSPNRGFFVSPLTLSEAEEIYPLIWTLESLAIKLQSTFSDRLIGKLKERNDKLSRSGQSPKNALISDRKWHKLLVAGCGNQLLLSSLELLKQKAMRYELAFMKDESRILHSVDQHNQIADILKAGQSQKAAQLLQRHWRRSLNYITDWISKDR